MPLTILGAEDPRLALTVGDRQGPYRVAEAFGGDLSRLPGRDKLEVTELGIGKGFDGHS